MPSTAPGPAGATRPCPACGNLVPPGFVFCGQCGNRLDVAATKQSAPQPVAHAAARGKLVLIRPDGTEGGSHPLNHGSNVIGRGIGPLFDADSYLSPKHAELVLGPTSMTVRDQNSLNGVFLKIGDEEEIGDGEVFRIGQELLRFDVIHAPQPLEDGTEVMGSPNPGYWGRVALVVGRDQDGSAFPLFGDAVILGRERGDILFPEDGYVSGTHARLSYRDGRYFLADMNSSNGSFLRIRGERQIRTGTFLLMGQQLFRVQFS
jgi:pSer/pThr/pTyr-binding forkhead associated (FHA) protein